MPDHEKEKEKEREKEKSGAPVVAEPSLTSPANPAQHKVAPPTEEEAASAFLLRRFRDLTPAKSAAR